MRLLVTGGGGQLGRDLAHAAQTAGHDVWAPPRAELDITDRSRVRLDLDEFAPDVVVNAAAWTAVDACESDPNRADEVNGHAVADLAEMCRSHAAHLVQVSTDYVFDGTKAEPYTEGDTPNPLNAYGRSKLLGERAVGPDATVVRTSWVYSRHPGNILPTICRLAHGADPMRFVDDQIGRPTHTVDLAQAILALSDARAAGVWHCANAGATSWHGFAAAVLQALGLDPAQVDAVATADLEPPRAATRPGNSVLDTTRFDTTFVPLPDFRTGLADVVRAVTQPEGGQSVGP